MVYARAADTVRNAANATAEDASKDLDRSGDVNTWSDLIPGLEAIDEVGLDTPLVWVGFSSWSTALN